MGRPSLDHKGVVVTGAGAGLGRAYALDLAGAGAHVVVNDVDEAAARSVVDEIAGIGGHAVIASGSVADRKTAEKVIATAVEAFGRLDGLVNNAGVFYVAEPDEEDPGVAAQMVEVNLLGTLYCGLLAIRHMVVHGGGSIVNDTSGAAAGMRRRGTYGATKGATASLTYSWAIDLVDRGVRVNAISPIARTGMVDRGMARGERGTDVPPEHVAPLVTYLISEDAAQVTGQLLRFEGPELSVLSRPGARRRTVRADVWDHDGISATVQRLLSGEVPER